MTTFNWFRKCYRLCLPEAIVCVCAFVSFENNNDKHIAVKGVDATDFFLSKIEKQKIDLIYI